MNNARNLPIHHHYSSLFIITSSLFIIIHHYSSLFIIIHHYGTSGLHTNPSTLGRSVRPPRIKVDPGVKRFGLQFGCIGCLIFYVFVGPSTGLGSPRRCLNSFLEAVASSSPNVSLWRFGTHPGISGDLRRYPAVSGGLRVCHRIGCQRVRFGPYLPHAPGARMTGVTPSKHK